MRSLHCINTSEEFQGVSMAALGAPGTNPGMPKRLQCRGSRCHRRAAGTEEWQRIPPNTAAATETALSPLKIQTAPLNSQGWDSRRKETSGVTKKSDI